MKIFNTLKMIVVLALFVAAAGTAVRAQTASDQNAQMGTDNSASMNSTSMSAYKDSITTRLRAADEKIDALKNSTDNMTGTKRDQMDTRIAQLKGKRDTVKKMLNNLKANSATESRAAVENAMTDLETSITNTTMQ